MPKKLVTQRQTVIDIAVQLYGNTDDVFKLIAENPAIESLDNDPTGIEVDYQINKTFTQRYFINKGIDAATKPVDYLNTFDPALLAASDSFLLQENGYKLLL